MAIEQDKIGFSKYWSIADIEHKISNHLFSITKKNEQKIPMVKIYLDTSAIEAAIDSKDKHHLDAIHFISMCQKEKILLY